MDKSEFKRYAISSLYTFLSGFVIAIIHVLDSMNWQNVGVGSLVGLAFVGVRGGIKVLGEAFLVWKDKKES